MALSIDQFKTRIRENLPASQYEVIVAPPVGGTELIQVRTESIALPGVSVLSVDNFSPYGNGIMYNIPYRYNPQEVTMTHLVDSEGDLYKTFRAWMNQVVDLDGTNKFGAKFLSPGGGGYSVDADVNVFNREQKQVLKIKFIEMFPINVDSMQLGWGQNDEIAKLSVTYRFTRFEIK